eukprot:3377493-Rhodomonas_salina.1
MGLEDTQEESEDAKQNDLGAGITREELATCCRVLKILGEEQKVFSSPQFKELRICLQPLLDIEGKKRFAGSCLRMRYAMSYTDMAYLPGGSKEEIAARREQQQTVNRIQQQVVLSPYKTLTSYAPRSLCDIRCAQAVLMVPRIRNAISETDVGYAAARQSHMTSASSTTLCCEQDGSRA